MMSERLSIAWITTPNAGTSFFRPRAAPLPAIVGPKTPAARPVSRSLLSDKELVDELGAELITARESPPGVLRVLP